MLILTFFENCGRVIYLEREVYGNRFDISKLPNFINFFRLFKMIFKTLSTISTPSSMFFKMFSAILGEILDNFMAFQKILYDFNTFQLIQLSCFIGVERGRGEEGGGIILKQLRTKICNK